MPNDFTHWNEIPTQIVDAIEAQARGVYQRNLLNGWESWSGASLRGKASTYGAVYARSRGNLVKRINDALPEGWSASTRLVLRECYSREGVSLGRRNCRELVVTGPETEYLYCPSH